MQALVSLNLALAFALELAMLAAFAFFGFRITDHSIVRWVLAIGLPVLVAGLWGILLAPKATHRLPMVPGILLSLGLFLLAAVALYVSDRPGLAIAMGAAAILHAVLAFVWGQW